MTTRQTLKRFMEPIIISRKSMINMLAYDIFTYAGIIFLVQCTQYAIQGIEQGNKTFFLQWIRIMLGISVILIIMKVFRKPYAFKIFPDIWYSIDTLYLKKIIYGNNIQFERLGTGKLITAYSKGAGTWSDLGTNFITDGLTTLFLFGYFLYTASTKSFDMFRGILGALILISIRFWKFGGLSYGWRAKAKENELEKARMQARWLMSKYEIMQTANIPCELKKSNRMYDERYSIKLREKLLQGIGFDVPFFIACLLFTLLIWISGKNVLHGSLQLSDMVGIIGIGTIFIKELDNMLRKFRFLFDKWIDITKLRDIVDTLSTGNQQFEVGKKIVITNKSIKLENVSFSYNENTENTVLSALSLIISGKQKTALVGPSGGGKSTLIKLIAGYLEPNSGSVIVDGQDLQDISLLSYYKHIGYLTQEPSVFDGTIRENLEYGIALPSPSNDEGGATRRGVGGEVLTLAKCERIYDLPHGLDTEIGERGVRLSGGQKQRLAIAKIMLKNPDIILLDEPTSALDSANEQAVTEALNNLFNNKTVIIIAHRLQTVKNADDIIYIADGKVIERGTHTELLALGGEYYKMVELQSGF